MRLVWNLLILNRAWVDPRKKQCTLPKAICRRISQAVEGSFRYGALSRYEYALLARAL
jgi:hypothetical protein